MRNAPASSVEELEGPIAAGRFASWVAITIDARSSRGKADVDVPCGTCTACCRSSYFIHVEPDETAARRRIPADLLFPAPGRPKGHMVLGFDEHGRCPMLAADGCSIYEDRPRTCRSYDCRVFAAAGLSPRADGKDAIADRVERWRFEFPTADDEAIAGAVRAAATFLGDRPECFPDGTPPTSAGELALLAVKVHELFLPSARLDGVAAGPTIDDVRRAIR